MELNFPKIEERILKFWKENRIFDKSIKQRVKARNFVFYEGPPTANAEPGIHHVLSRVYKDIICRYKTMQGFKVLRKAGWDTHGLPVELEIEKKLGLKSKKDIEKYGIAKFNKLCKESVWKYKKDWERLTERIAFWLNMENPYITYESNYIETVWWVIKEIWQKGLLYQGYKVVPYCPRCGTSLSSHEVALGYEKIKEPVIYIKFKLKSQNSKLLVWTTTPWTLPGNVAIAVNPKFTYVKVKVDDEYLILAKERMEASGIKGKTIEKFKGEDLIGLEYQPLFEFVKPEKPAFRVISGDFVSLAEGTGLVHIAPAFGEEDLQVGKENNLPILLNVDEEGRFKPEVKGWTGMYVKEADPLIIEDLKNRNLLFKEELYEHDYPFCWRCETPLLYYAKQSWFIRMTKVKKDLIKNNQKINWIPAHLKGGRFGEWLREIKDWAFSRERYWGIPLPIWQCQKCNKMICVGSIKELKEKSGTVEIKDLHRPHIDKITFKCNCSSKMERVPEVIDCWFDSGTMPFAQYHYPFENRNLIDKRKQFPADYISEAVDQTRGWFYTLLAISTLLEKGPAFKNVISLGHVLDENGEKMSKSKGNVVDPWYVIEKYSTDATRWYFYTINQPGDAKLFRERDVEESLKKFLMTLWNSYLFFQTYGKISNLKSQISKLPAKTQNLLDRWIISKLNKLIGDVTQKLDNYDVTNAARVIENFTIEDLSQWYIRRSRRRFQKPETLQELKDASATLGCVLLTLSKLTAPFIPFLSEEIYKNLTKRQSIHLENWPKVNKNLIDEKLERKMEEVREIITLALAKRAKASIKVRQPLDELRITNYELRKEKELLDLIKEEINVKKITFGKSLKLDTKITPELKEEGMIREVIRQIQEMRKIAGYKPRHRILVRYSGTPNLNKILTKNKNFIQKEAKIKNFQLGEKLKQIFDVEREIKIDQQKLWLGIKKI